MTAKRGRDGAVSSGGDKRKERAPAGSGSIYEDTHKGGYRGYVTIDGKRIYRYGRTKTQVRRKLQEVESKHACGTWVPNTKKVTLAEFAERWLEQRKPPAMPHSSWNSYEPMVRLHVVPELGHLKIAEIKPVQIQEALARLRNKVSKATGRPLSPRTVQCARALIHRMLQEAWAAGLCSGNVCDAVDGPKLRREPRIVWTKEELERFLRTTQGTRFEALWSFLTVTGCRIEEALALNWQDIDLDAGKVLISKQLYRAKGIEIIKQPKSQSGIRTLHLPAPTVELLKQLRASQFDHEKIVFATLGGKYLPYSTIKQVLYRECERAGVRRVSFHNFRHLAATYLIALGMDPRSVSEFLGHGDKSLVMRTYAHAMSGHAERAASLLTPFVTLPAQAEHVRQQGGPSTEVLPHEPGKTETPAKPKPAEPSMKKIKRRRKLRVA